MFTLAVSLENTLINIFVLQTLILKIHCIKLFDHHCEFILYIKYVDPLKLCFIKQHHLFFLLKDLRIMQGSNLTFQSNPKENRKILHL